MRRTALYLLAFVFVTVLSVQYAQVKKSENAVQRGQYLVERVAMCVDCHSPRDQKGEFARERWLGGSPVDFKPLHPMLWADVAPPLAGLPGWKTEEAVKLLVTALPPNGKALRPPMPAYKMVRDDAKAIVAYLKSLPPVQATSELRK